MKIGIFYGSDTGNTEEIAKVIADKIGMDKTELIEISDASNSDVEGFSLLIFGTSTWYDGDLQSDWEDFFPNLDYINFNGKTVALFGLGDQYTYADYFVDGMGMIYDKIIEKGARVVGRCSTKGYDFEESVAARNGEFIGLALDEDNEHEKTDKRLDEWLKLIGSDFGF